jgi:hypothetical protein
MNKPEKTDSHSLIDLTDVFCFAVGFIIGWSLI